MIGIDVVSGKGKYAAEWDVYQKRRRKLYMFFLPLCVMAVALFGLGWVVGPPLPKWAGVFLFLVIWFFILTDTIRTSLFRCPRCHRHFYWSWYNNQFARRCTHCGLPKWSEDDPVESDIHVA